MHYYKKNIGDYRGATSHLTLLEHGVYGWLLDTYYMDEKPLPLDERQLFRVALARTEEEKQAVRDVLNEFFVKTENGWLHNRCELEIKAFHAKAESNRKNGNKGGRPAKQNPNKTQSVISDNPQETLTINHKPITINQEPLTNNHNIKNNNVDLSARRESVVQVFEFWKTIFGKNAATKLNAVRERKIKQRLDDGYTVEQIKTAIVNCSKSEFHVQGGHTDIELICRDGIKLDRFIEMTIAQQQTQTDPWAAYFQNLGKQSELDVTPVQEIGHVKS